MAKLVSEGLCEKVVPLLPPEPTPASRQSRPGVTSPPAFTGLVFAQVFARILGGTHTGPNPTDLAARGTGAAVID